MKLTLLGEWLRWIRSSSGGVDDRTESTSRPFVPGKRLCERDMVIIDMLNSQGHEAVSFCITDPELNDNPVIYINGGFTNLTGYTHEDVEGRNCRFLQGPETSEEDVKYISDAIRRDRECSVNLVNYKKDGTKFVNEVSRCFSFLRQ
jgi:PAS domain-containing protein